MDTYLLRIQTHYAAWETTGTFPIDAMAKGYASRILSRDVACRAAYACTLYNQTKDEFVASYQVKTDTVEVQELPQ